jgi:hypothetical protein
MPFDFISDHYFLFVSVYCNWYNTACEVAHGLLIGMLTVGLYRNALRERKGE